MPPSTPGPPPPPPSRDLSIAESVQRAQAIAASLARSKGALGTPQQQGGSQGPPPPAPPPASTPSPGQHAFSQRPSASGQRGPPHPPPPFEHAAGALHESGFSQEPPGGARGGGAPTPGLPRGAPFDHGSVDKQQSQHVQTPGRGDASWSSVDAAAAIAAQQKQMLQQRARRAALRAMETVCAAIPKPDIKESDLLGELKKTVRQLENGVWVMDFPLQSGVCAATAASPHSWQQLQRQELLANLRRRTGAGFVLRGRQQQQQQRQEVYLRVASEDQEAVFRGVVAAWSVVGARQHLPAPVDAGDDETFDCAFAMAGEEDEFLKDVLRRTGAFVEIEHEPPQGYGSERGSLRYSAAACTQAAMDKATRLLRWRLVCIEEAWRQHNAHGFTRDASPHRGGWREFGYGYAFTCPALLRLLLLLLRLRGFEAVVGFLRGFRRRQSLRTASFAAHASSFRSGVTGQEARGSAASSFWHSAMPDEAEMMRRRREAEERRKKRGQQRSRSVSPERRGPPNKLSFAPPPDELLTGPYAPLDK